MSNPVSNVAFVQPQLGGERFFFNLRTDLAHVPHGFKGIIVGMQVEFTPSSIDATRPKARRVIPLSGTGVETVDPAPKGIPMDAEGIVSLRVDSVGRAYTLRGEEASLIAASVRGTDGSFRAFKAGGMIKVFCLRMPAHSADQVFLVLDPKKNMLSSNGGREISGVAPGSYILFLDGGGNVAIQTIGRRFQIGAGGGNWVVIHRRLELSLDLERDIREQIPTSGLTRDNDGFADAIVEAAALLKQQREQVPA